MEFLRQHPKLVSTISIAIISLCLLANIVYFIFIPIQVQGDPAGFVATPLPASQQVSRDAPPQTASPVSMVFMMIILAMVLLLFVILLAVLKYLDFKRKQRDKQRKQDLKTLAQAFEAYKQIHGQYPMSSTFRPEYYTGVNLSNDWNYYGLPNKEHMSRFIPNWPISDPSIDYMSRSQVNQYLYYPKDNGQKFYLYAHLESPKKSEQIDYNHQDNLLRSWGNYNYRVESGQEQPIQVHDDHVNSPVPPSLPPQSASPEPAPAVSNPEPTTNPAPEPLPSNAQPMAAQAEEAPATSAPVKDALMTTDQPSAIQPQPDSTAAITETELTSSNIASQPAAAEIPAPQSTSLPEQTTTPYPQATDTQEAQGSTAAEPPAQYPNPADAPQPIVQLAQPTQPVQPQPQPVDPSISQSRPDDTEEIARDQNNPVSQ